MTSAISNKELVNKCKRFILKDTTRIDVDALIQDAIITASREIADLGGAQPVSWNRERYAEIYTRYPASISAVTNDNPGVITALSTDPQIGTGSFPYVYPFTFAGHGFEDNDIVWIEGINAENSVYQMNQRLFRVVDIDGETLSLKTLDGQTAINTTNWVAYDSGGYIYHAGLVLPSSIEPSTGDAWSQWNIKRVYNATVDNYPCNPITNEEAIAQRINQPGCNPYRWRYQQYAYGSFTSVEHLFFWYPYAPQRLNIEIYIEKDYPDISSFTTTAYPPHPMFIHDFVWHRALAILATHSEKAMRRSATKDGSGDNTKIEILNANYWISKSAEEETRILEYSRMMEGNQPYYSQGMSA